MPSTAVFSIPKKAKGQTTIEYVLLICLFSVPLSYAIWYAFLHKSPGGKSRLAEFLSLITDFVRW